MSLLSNAEHARRSAMTCFAVQNARMSIIVTRNAKEKTGFLINPIARPNAKKRRSRTRKTRN